MGTESLVRILGNSDRWQAIKGSPRYRPSTSEMAIEGLDFLTLKDQLSQIQDKDVMPNRSESAPPSMEGSLVAMANIVPHCKINSALFPDSSSPIKSHVNGEKNSKLSRDKLPSHEEESEDDHLCVSGYRSQSLDSMQDTSQASSPSSQKPPKNEQLTRQNSGPPHQAPPQHLNTSRVLDSSSQIIYPALTHAYGGSNQLHHNPSNIPMAYMASQGPFYYNIPATGFFGLQYRPGVYNLNSTILPSYVPGYPHQGATFPMAFNGANFFGRVGVPLQPPPFHFQNFQLPFRDPYDSYGHPNHQSPRDNINPVNFHDSKKGSEHLSGYKNLNLQLGNMSGQQPKQAAVSITSLSNSSVGNPSRMSGQSPAWKDANLNYFLEELKSGIGQRLMLSDLEGYIVEFSVDQHGSRFIQQKLVTCSIEEKASVFKEVIPHASKLITDVFGNYVVQKLFEHGNSVERMNLADQLKGQILPLSLQMYGCRVIQKALDVIDLEQKTRLIRELDGHVLRCVRDQNGNHVIQKCIETIPIDNIHFIVSSFRGQVGSLSLHPYGCRVIQRFLEHYSDNLQTKFIVDEILDSVCSLAQDQYGNYVTQHALERGNPHERTRIIEKLGGSIVQLSQHKFSSNVIEKCLEYSDSDAREMLIKEIIGDGNNDNLLVMMKDQYANYVIQRILEKCSNDHREVLLTQIKGHLTVLKKYTYGKHIVSRFEKLYGEGLVSKETPS